MLPHIVENILSGIGIFAAILYAMLIQFKIKSQDAIMRELIVRVKEIEDKQLLVSYNQGQDKL